MKYKKYGMRLMTAIPLLVLVIFLIDPTLYIKILKYFVEDPKNIVETQQQIVTAEAPTNISETEVEIPPTEMSRLTKIVLGIGAAALVVFLFSYFSSNGSGNSDNASAIHEMGRHSMAENKDLAFRVAVAESLKDSTTVGIETSIEPKVNLVDKVGLKQFLTWQERAVGAQLNTVNTTTAASATTVDPDTVIATSVDTVTNVKMTSLGNIPVTEIGNTFFRDIPIKIYDTSLGEIYVAIEDRNPNYLKNPSVLVEVENLTEIEQKHRWLFSEKPYEHLIDGKHLILLEYHEKLLRGYICIEDIEPHRIKFNAVPRGSHEWHVLKVLKEMHLEKRKN